MNVPVHRLLALILSLSCGCAAWAGGGNGSVSVAPICHRGDCRPGHSQAVRVQGALLQAAALSVASGAVGRQGSARPGKDLPRRHQTRLPSWYKRAQAAQLRGQAVPVAARVQRQVPIRARVREARPAADIADLTVLSEDRELASDSLLQGDAGQAVFGSRLPSTDDHPGENHTMIGNVSGTISNHSSNAPARVRGGALSHSGARTVLHTATALSLISPRRAAPGRSGKARTAVPTRPHEQLSVPGLRQKDVGKRKSGVRVRESGGVQTAHAGKKGKVKDRTQSARPAGGRTGSTAANPFESASSMKMAGPRSEARGAHHRHLVQESMDIEQDVLDRQMRDLDLDDEMGSMAPDEAMGTEGEELDSRAGPEPESARGKRSVDCQPDADGVIRLNDEDTLRNCLDGTGTYPYSINITTDGAFYLFSAAKTRGLLNSGVNLTLVDSEIRSTGFTEGSIQFFEPRHDGISEVLRDGFKNPVNITIQSSKLIAQNGINLIPFWASSQENCDITLNIERQSELKARGGELILLTSSRCRETDPGVSIKIDGESQITATKGSIRLVESLTVTTLDMNITDARLHSGRDLYLANTSGVAMVTLSMQDSTFHATNGEMNLVPSCISTNLQVDIGDSHLHVENGNLTLVGQISGTPSTMILSMNNSTLTASSTSDGKQFLQVVPVGSVFSANNTLLVKNCRNNTVKVELMPGADISAASAIAHLGWQRSCGSLRGNTLQQSQLMNNTVRAIVKNDQEGSGYVAYASLAGVYRDASPVCLAAIPGPRWHLEQSQLEGNRVEAQTNGGVSLASLGVIRDETDKDLYLNQTNFINNTVKATAGSGGTAVSGLTLAENCGCSISFTNACNSTAEPACKADCSLVQVNLTQCGMDGNQLTVAGNSSLGTPSLLFSRDLLLPLSISGNGTIQCPDLARGNVTSADCRMRVCGNQTACPQPPTEGTTFTIIPEGTTSTSTPASPGGAPGGDIAALGSLALLLPASCGALMTIGVCAAYHKKRQQKAEYPVQDVMAMESRFVGAKAADQEPAAAEPSAVQWHKGDDQYDPESDEEASDRRENLYEGVKDSPAAHF